MILGGYKKNFFYNFLVEFLGGGYFGIWMIFINKML